MAREAITCPNCGAPAPGSGCGYCGSAFEKKGYEWVEFEHSAPIPLEANKEYAFTIDYDSYHGVQMWEDVITTHGCEFSGFRNV